MKIYQGVLITLHLLHVSWVLSRGLERNGNRHGTMMRDSHQYNSIKRTAQTRMGPVAKKHKVHSNGPKIQIIKHMAKFGNTSLKHTGQQFQKYLGRNTLTKKQQQHANNAHHIYTTIHNDNKIKFLKKQTPKHISGSKRHLTIKQQHSNMTQVIHSINHDFTKNKFLKKQAPKHISGSKRHHYYHPVHYYHHGHHHYDYDDDDDDEDDEEFFRPHISPVEPINDEIDRIDKIGGGIEPIDQIEPIEPMEGIESIEPIQSIEPVGPIERDGERKSKVPTKTHEIVGKGKSSIPTKVSNKLKGYQQDKHYPRQFHLHEKNEEELPVKDNPNNEPKLTGDRILILPGGAAVVNLDGKQNYRGIVGAKGAMGVTYRATGVENPAKGVYDKATGVIMPARGVDTPAEGATEVPEKATGAGPDTKFEKEKLKGDYYPSQDFFEEKHADFEEDDDHKSLTSVKRENTTSKTNNDTQRNDSAEITDNLNNVLNKSSSFDKKATSTLTSILTKFFPTSNKNATATLQKHLASEFFGRGSKNNSNLSTKNKTTSIENKNSTIKSLNETYENHGNLTNKNISLASSHNDKINLTSAINVNLTSNVSNETLRKNTTQQQSFDCKNQTLGLSNAESKIDANYKNTSNINKQKQLLSQINHTIVDHRNKNNSQNLTSNLDKYLTLMLKSEQFPKAKERTSLHEINSTVLKGALEKYDIQKNNTGNQNQTRPINTSNKLMEENRTLSNVNKLQSESTEQTPNSTSKLNQSDNSERTNHSLNVTSNNNHSMMSSNLIKESKASINLTKLQSANTKDRLSSTSKHQSDNLEKTNHSLNVTSNKNHGVMTSNLMKENNTSKNFAKFRSKNTKQRLDSTSKLNQSNIPERTNHSFNMTSNKNPGMMSSNLMKDNESSLTLTKFHNMDTGQKQNLTIQRNQSAQHILSSNMTSNNNKHAVSFNLLIGNRTSANNVTNFHNSQNLTQKLNQNTIVEGTKQRVSSSNVTSNNSQGISLSNSKIGNETSANLTNFHIVNTNKTSNANQSTLPEKISTNVKSNNNESVTSNINGGVTKDLEESSNALSTNDLFNITKSLMSSEHDDIVNNLVDHKENKKVEEVDLQDNKMELEKAPDAKEIGNIDSEEIAEDEDKEPAEKDEPIEEKDEKQNPEIEPIESEIEPIPPIKRIVIQKIKLTEMKKKNLQKKMNLFKRKKNRNQKSSRFHL